MSQDIQRYVRMLESSDPQQRRQAIIALGRSRDRAALTYLHRVYKSDPNEALRQLARQAGNHLQQNLSSASDDRYSTVPPPSQKPVSERDRKKAKTLVDRAIDAQVRQNTQDVIALLAEAIQLDPSLERNSTVLGLLAGAFNTDAQTALHRLKAENQAMAARGMKRKTTSSTDWSETVNFALEVGIWFIVIALFGAASIFFSVDDAFWDEMRAGAVTQGASTNSGGQTITTQQQLNSINSLEESFDSLGPLFALFGGLFYSLFLTGIALFMSLIAWWVGLTFLGGDGLLYPFLTAMLRVVIVTLFISTAIGFISQFFNPYSDTGILLSFAPTVLGIAVMAWTIGHVHGFGIAMGCVNMIGTAVACGVFGCCCPYMVALVG